MDVGGAFGGAAAGRRSRSGLVVVRVAIAASRQQDCQRQAQCPCQLARMGPSLSVTSHHRVVSPGKSVRARGDQARVRTLISQLKKGSDCDRQGRKSRPEKRHFFDSDALPRCGFWSSARALSRRCHRARVASYEKADSDGRWRWIRLMLGRMFYRSLSLTTAVRRRFESMWRELGKFSKGCRNSLVLVVINVLRYLRAKSACLDQH